MDEVAHADPVPVSVAARDDHLELRVRQLCALGHREGAAVDRVEPVRRQEVRQFARAPDPGHDEDVPRLELKGVDRRLQRPEDREVAAARTPGGLDLGLVRLHLELEFHATASKMWSAMSRQVNGSPSDLP